MKIAIDGPAGAGKSTIAKLVAKKLGFIYIDTGAMYRALTYIIIENKIDYQDNQQLYQLANSINIHFENHSNTQRIICNGKDVTEKIRTPQVNSLVSKIAAINEIREIMVQKQQEMASQKDVVMDGRDIGECVLPDAEFKFYITASLEERARRRLIELKNQGYEVDFEHLKKDLLERDNLDKNRGVGALKILKDSIVINTSELTIDELLDKIISIVQEDL
ncbi:Cytidylate kinase [Candidatus Syntrophocurvum alkaliphilum]|uniref:Cytidylate kinase n=1 Tax=Candidatus Syntrophocurvum alkaliphilum TaxID=2293317 RepID=A0A6I6DFJ5_9FIRM|nr:(d)CMP kinase [Candidatus Syntrophocurvum alkaliphilum]QGT99847.1 Cytidylate kinase [Candidatus Syntrophocurvum alkaliphilum]